MALKLSVLVSGVLPCVAPTLSLRFISSGTSALARYHPHYVDPKPDPLFYMNNKPKASDEIALRPVKAAPTSQTYSIFYDEGLYKFEKMLIKKGRSNQSRRIVRSALEYVKSVQVAKYHRASEEERESIEVNPLVIFHQALENAKPLLGLRGVTKGGSKYWVPVLMKPEHQFFFVVKAITNHVWEGRPKTDAALRLGKEILAAYNNDGAAVKAKQEQHKKAYSNRAYLNLLT